MGIRNQFSRLSWIVAALVPTVLCAVMLVYLMRMSRSLDELRSHVQEVDRWQRLPVLDDMKTAKLGERTVKLKDYPLPAGPTKVKYWNEADLPFAAWNPADKKPLYPFPKKLPYRGRPFHPWEFLLNVVALCNWADQHKALSDVEPIIADLFADLEPNLEEKDGALWFRYSYSHTCYDQRVDAGWVSGFGNAAILCAFVRLHQTTHDTKHRELAQKVFASFRHICKSPRDREPWFAIVDESDYLWFEEFPCRSASQTHIMNGHVFALMALDQYRSLDTPDRAEAETLMRAGIATMQRYLCEYRRPGQVNRYSLYAPWMHRPDNVDYLPSRTVDCAEWLHAVSGEACFETLARQFRSDHPTSP